MSNLKNKILSKLHEGTVSADELKKNTDDLVKTAKDALDIDDAQAKDYVSGFIGEASDETGFNPVVQYHSDRTDETPFMINGTKWQYVNAIYPDGKKDIAVYRYGHDLAYDYKWFMDNVVGKLKNAADVTEVNQEVMDSMIKQYGPEKGKQIYYATANKQDRDPETFHNESDEIASRGIEYGMNPEVEADKYEEYRALMAQLAAEEGEEGMTVKESGPITDIEGVTDSLINMYINGYDDNEIYSIIKKTSDGHGMDSQTKREFYMTLANKLKKASLNNPSLSDKLMRASQTYNSISRTGIKEDDTMGQEPQQKNDPVKLKADVAKLMARLDMSGIAPYLDRIDNPVEQAEVIGQFAEKIGVPRAKLSMVVAQLKQVAENTDPKMTKNKLVEAVTGRKIIKTIKVKDIK